MELRQLRYLVAIVDHGTFTAAAEALHVAQPALSQQMRRLEAEVGLPLLRRAPRGVTPTDAGGLLVARARRVLSELDAATAELDELQGLLRGRVVLGAMGSLGPVDLPALLARFHAEHPQVTLEVKEEPTAELVRLLAADAVDLAFATRQPALPSGVVEQVMAHEDLVLVVAPDHPLAGRRSPVRLGVLAQDPWIAFKGGTGLRQAMDAATAAAGVRPHVAFASNELDRVLALVARGLGVSVVPRSTAMAARDPIAIVDVTPRLRREIVLLWREDRPHAPAARALLALIRRPAAPAVHP
ncbi:HTH-type transcriptional regulator CynR [Paraconexibacter sp. AEG42_29]|uniref:HTH-type transcriptional regulator CynR n=1 Tax=Paraconexibacter sp. AEG42_29 TaxID=2997339 RepID=A0AAU7ANW2_9ACTN